MTEIWKKWQTVLLIALMTSALVFAVMILVGPRYELKVSLIAVPGQNEKDNFLLEYYSKNLSQIVAGDEFESIIKKEYPKFFAENRKMGEDFFVISKENSADVFILRIFGDSPYEVGNLTNLMVENINEIVEKNGHSERISLAVLKKGAIIQSPTFWGVMVAVFLSFVFGLFLASSLVWFFPNFGINFIFQRQARRENDEQNWLREKIKAQMERKNLGEKDFSKEIYGKNFPEQSYVISKKEKNIFNENEEVSSPLAVEEEKNIPMFQEEQASGMGEVLLDQERGKIEYEKKESLFVDMRRKEDDKKNVFPIEEDGDGILSKKEERVFALNKKASAPDNLPIFLPEEEMIEEKKEAQNFDKKDGFVSLEDLENEEKCPQEGDISNNLNKNEKEPSEEEVKERLNKLLRGEL